MALFSNFLLLITVSGQCCLAEQIDIERSPDFPTDDFLLPSSLCPSSRPLCSNFDAHQLGGCWCNCPKSFSFYEHQFKCLQGSDALRSAGCELGFTDEAEDKSLPFFPYGSALDKIINVPADQNCSFNFGNQLYVNYLRCDGTWKSQSLTGIVEVTRGWSTSQLSIRLKLGSSLPKSIAGRIVRIAIQCGPQNSELPFKSTCIMFKVKGAISCSYPQPTPSQFQATLPTTSAKPTEVSDGIENSPIFCQESGQIEIENQVYLAKCFFFCCRGCNKDFYKCITTVHRGYCLKIALDCGEKCAKVSLLNITVKGL